VQAADLVLVSWFSELRAFARETGTREERLQVAYADEVVATIERGLSVRVGQEQLVVPRQQVGLGDEVRSLDQALASLPGAPTTVLVDSTPNQSARSGVPVDTIVIHDTEGGWSGALSTMKNPANEVSAHYLVRSSDGLVFRLVPEERKAWHAGTCWNNRSVGVEHEGFAAQGFAWYTEEMYAASAKLTSWIADKWGIPKDRDHFKAHSELTANACNDHSDPGRFWNWDHYMALVRAGGTLAPPEPPSQRVAAPPGTLLAASADALFTPVQPWRALDTRGGGFLVGGVPYTAALGVPGDCQAALVNLTVTVPQSAGWLSAGPSATSAASNLNFTPGQTVANAAVSAVGAGGTLTFLSSASTHLVADVQGVFGPSGAGYEPRSPVRALDTRDGSGRLEAGGVRAVSLAGLIPPGSVAVALNLTVVSPDQGGYATVFACGNPLPGTSTVNFEAGQVVANFAASALGQSDGICIFSSAATDLVVDVQGSFRGNAGLRLLASAPVRVLDTRDGTGGWLGRLEADQEIDLGASIPGLPADARALALNVTVTEPASDGWLSVSPCAAPPSPLTSNVNFTAGATVPNLVFATLDGAQRTCVRASSRLHLVVDAFGAFH